MKLHEEFKLWENMWNTSKQSRKSLNEKWETFDLGWGPVKLWHSNSVSEFRAFLNNIANTSIKGLRLSIAKGVYLAAKASELTHDNIVELANKEQITDLEKFEWSTIGIPKIDDFNYDNVEKDLFDWVNYDYDPVSHYANLKNQPIVDPETGEFLWIHDGKSHTLVADCGSFEVNLYNFYSLQFPEFKFGDKVPHNHSREKWIFEESETYFALKPLIKKLYMTNPGWIKVML